MFMNLFFIPFMAVLIVGFPIANLDELESIRFNLPIWLLLKSVGRGSLDRQARSLDVRKYALSYGGITIY